MSTTTQCQQGYRSLNNTINQLNPTHTYRVRLLSDAHATLPDRPCCCCLAAQSCPTLCNPMDSSSVHGILQARILEWIAIPFSKGSSQPRNLQTLIFRVSCISRILYHWATREAWIDHVPGHKTNLNKM